MVEGAASLYQMVLLTLCSNYKYFMDPMSNLDCEFKSSYAYDLLSLRGKTLRITTVEKMPLSGTTIQNGELVGTGVAFNMFHEIQEKLGFKYVIIKPEINEIGNSTHGVINQLKNNEVDLAVMFFPMLKEYRKYVVFSQSLGEFDWVLLMKRPLASATGSGLLAPFEFNVWLAILVSVVVVGPVVYFLITTRSRLCKEDSKDKNQRYPLSACVWFVYGALMKQGSTLSPISDSARILFATWWIFITILTSFYTANLTAFLTLSQFTLTIKSPTEIHTYKRYWLADYGGHTYEMINSADEFNVLKSMVPQYGRYINNSNEVFPSVMKDEIYVAERRKAIGLILGDYLNKTERGILEQDRCTYVLTKPFLAKPMAFAYPKNTTLHHLLNPMLAQLVQGGIVDHLLDQPLPMTTICPLNLASSERKLRNGDLKTTYLVVGAGFAAAAIAFFVEITYRRYKRGQLNTLSINSGDIAGHILGQGGLKSKNTFPVKTVGLNGFLDGNHQKSPSAFLFQYTN